MFRVNYFHFGGIKKVTREVSSKDKNPSASEMFDSTLEEILFVEPHTKNSITENDKDVEASSEDSDSSTTTASSFDESNEDDGWEERFQTEVATTESRVRWHCQFCKHEIPGDPKTWFSVEATNPYGHAACWFSSNRFRSWQTIDSRPGFLRYFFCASECLRKYAYQDRQQENNTSSGEEEEEELTFH